MPKRALVFCGDQYHPAEPMLRALESAGQGEFVFEPAPDGPLAAMDPGYDLIVLAKLNASSETDRTPWATPESEAFISDAVEQGTGLLVIHAGSAGYPPEGLLRKATGGAFLHHPEPLDVTLESSDGTSFTVHDEHYFADTDPDVTIFLHSRSEHGTQPAGWTKTHGQGKVYVLTPGHFAAVHDHPAFQQLLAKGLNDV